MNTEKFLITADKDVAKYLIENGAGFVIYRDGIWYFCNSARLKHLDIPEDSYTFVDEYPF